MIKKPSGPYCDSYIAVTGAAADGASLELRLCCFQTGQSALLPEHRDALYRHVYKGTWQAQGAWIDLIGYASKLKYAHKESGNLDLSRDRCAAVKKMLDPWLSGLGRNFRINVVQGLGDTESQDDPTLDHPFNRAVLVRLFTVGRYHYEPDPGPPARIWEPQRSTRFEFQALESTGVTGGPFQTGVMVFSIHDMVNHRVRYFSYFGAGISVPTSMLPAVMASAQHVSSPVPFTTDVPFLDLKDFEGHAVLGGLPGATLNANSVGGMATFYMHPNLYIRRGITKPITVNFSFSRGFGVSLGDAGNGDIHMLGESFRPTTYSR